MESKKPDSREVAKWLGKWGFPKRHIMKLGEMHGPGLEAAERRTESVLSGNCLFILCGDRGPGKTQIATYWAQQMARNGKSAQYHKAHDLLCKIREQFDDDKQLKGSAREALQFAKTKKLLVIDEWSELAGTDWEKRTMTSIIDQRYDNLLSTIIITNHAPREAVEAVGKSIWSRAEETGGVVVCNWQSYRKA